MTAANTKGTDPMTQGLELPNAPLTTAKLIDDLTWLLTEGRKIARFKAPELGQHMDTGIQAIRRIGSGQTLGVSLRYIEAIIQALKAVPAQPAAAAVFDVETAAKEITDYHNRSELGADWNSRLVADVLRKHFQPAAAEGAETSDLKAVCDLLLESASTVTRARAMLLLMQQHTRQPAATELSSQPIAPESKDAPTAGGLKPDFMECDTCRAKPGTPLLCAGCLHNRGVIYQLTAELSEARAELQRLRGEG